MEGAIQTLVKVFIKSSKGKESLGKKEFQNLVKGQLSNILSDTDSKEAIATMGQGLDANQDGKVGFEEYMKLVGYLATSLSEQRLLAKEEPAQNSASGQVAQTTPLENGDDKPPANAEAKEEPKAEASEEPKAEATVEVKVEEKADGVAEIKVEVKTEGETEPEVAKEENPAAAVETVVASAIGAAPTEVEEAVNEEEKKDETEKVVEAAENLAAAVEEAVEKKIEEATS
ncbi:S100 calcium binding protein U [Xyrichtys novacula]|uniref:S100 calcium binding protein U n=1 Tax=Xyrichtys novacula TaxID=13765 RepID=A0AAV1HBU2_XYRNO|nr:S100 calcium binding protein U [Xyrichtys novacula]